MSAVIQAIQTRYNGRFFRSRLEARWAEVKHGEFLPIERAKVYRLTEITGSSVLMLDGPPRNDLFYMVERAEYLEAGEWKELPEEIDVILDAEYCHTEGRWFACTGESRETWKPSRYQCPRQAEAIAAALSARF